MTAKGSAPSRWLSNFFDRVTCALGLVDPDWYVQENDDADELAELRDRVVTLTAERDEALWQLGQCREDRKHYMQIAVESFDTHRRLFADNEALRDALRLTGEDRT